MIGHLVRDLTPNSKNTFFKLGSLGEVVVVCWLLNSTKTECDYLNVWIIKRSHTQKSHPKMVNPRDI